MKISNAKKIRGFRHRRLVLGMIFTTAAITLSCNRGSDSSTPGDAGHATGISEASGQEVADTTQWRQLFNGEDLTGWKHVGNGSRSVKDGLIGGHGGMGFLDREGEKFVNCMYY